MLCPNCDTRNDAKARFCRVCGTGLQAAAVTGATVQLAAPTAPAPCPHCLRVNPGGAKFCVFCATSLVGGAAPRQPQGVSNLVVQTNVNVAPIAALAYQAMRPMGGQQVPLVIRAVWFFFVGWWLGLIWTVFAWLFNVSLIFLPMGAWMLNRIPQIMTLRTPQPRAVMQGGALVPRPNHIPWPLRGIWFLVIGSWASLLWMMLAWALSATLILMPISFWMFDRVPTITTLASE